MRNADTTLGIIRERGRRRLPLEDVYRRLYNPHLFLLAYDHLRSNKGAMTPGVTGETIDGMSLEKITTIIEQLRYERYQWTPTKRVYIPKKNGGVRPLGLPTWSDKLVQEVMRLILDAYYDPQFCRDSHGFRPGRGCHTALRTIQQYWTGTRWFIEGDISRCFDNLDHEVLLHILGEKIHDNRFLRLVANMLKAGYLEEWRYNATLSGSPQGGVISPILSNIYLDKLDAFVVTNVSLGYNAGDARKRNPEYADLMKRRRNLQRHGRHEDAAHLLTQMHTLQSRLPDDPDYRRLRYIRYADDFLLGFDGPKEEAREIKEHLRRFLRDTLKLELSGEKTLITHAATERARFLGYELYTQWHAMPTQGKRSVNGKIGVNVPKDVTDGAIKKYMAKGKPIHRNGLLADSDFAIVRMYQSEYRGLVNYYVLAHNIHNFGQVQYVTETSLLKTLAAKHKASLMDMVRKYKAMTETPYGQMKCLRVVVNRDTEGKPPLVAEFGGIPLRRQRRVTQLDDTPQPIWAVHTDLLSRLLAQQCEMCGQKAEGTAPNIQVHHIRKMADLKKPGRKELSEWQRRMIGLRRKTLIVCHSCHVDIHAGRPMRQRQRRPA